jgi:hypothetical protein
MGIIYLIIMKNGSAALSLLMEAWKDVPSVGQEFFFNLKYLDQFLHAGLQHWCGPV